VNLSEKLDEIEARAKAATEGPWIFREKQDDIVGDGLRIAFTLNRRNAAFMASARTDVPRLVAALNEAVLSLQFPAGAEARILSILTGAS
jgi:hypothetical protein